MAQETTAILCCGSNFFGQLGIGNLIRENNFIPQHFGHNGNAVDTTDISNIVDIQCGAQFTIALYKDGSLKMCGSLNGVVMPQLTPIKITYPLKCIMVACGRKHVLALMEGGFVLSMGVSYFGQLGHGDDSPWDSPKLIHNLEPRRIGSRVAAVFAGGYHSAVLTEAGKVFMWGLNKSGQCGFPVSAGDSLVEPKLLDSEHWGNERVAQIVLGRTHSALRTASGAIYAWGATAFGRLGIASVSKKFVATPTEIQFFRGIEVVQLVSGDFHMLALDSQHRVYFWGYGAEGQNGLGHLQSSKIPRQIDFFEGLRMAKVFCGPMWCMALSSTGDLYAWGYGDDGWLGLHPPATHRLPLLESDSEKPIAGIVTQCASFDSRYNVLVPRHVQLLSNYGVKQVRCGSNFSIFICCERRSSPHSAPSSPTASESKNGSRYSGDEIKRVSQERSSKTDAKETFPTDVTMLTVEQLTCHFADWCRLSKIPEVDYAIAHGVNVNSVAVRDAEGNSPLLIACKHGQVSMCKLLVANRSDVTYANSKGNTALHYCFSNGLEELGRYLISLGADEFAVNQEGLTCYEGLTISDLDSI